MLSKGDLDHAYLGRVFHNIQANTSHGTRTRPQNLKSLSFAVRKIFSGVWSLQIGYVIVATLIWGYQTQVNSALHPSGVA